MNKSALQDIQQALNAIRSEIERVDDKTKWAALELILSTSNSVVALAKKMAKPVTRTVAVPKTKVIKQPVQQASKPAANDAVRTAIKTISPQKPLSNQQISQSAFENYSLMHVFLLCIILFDVISGGHSEAGARYYLIR